MKKLNIIILILISYVSAFSQQNILQNNLNEGEKTNRSILLHLWLKHLELD